MNSVIVLNASYEPLSPAKISRAVALITSGKAVLDDHYEDRFIRSANGLSLPFPKSIRLVSYVNVPFRYGEVTWSKEGVKRRDDYKCGYCGKKATTVDHIVPKARFNPRTEANTWANTVASCKSCNAKKGNRTPEECGMTLKIKPHTPTGIFMSSKEKYRTK